jgi:hypothetical protein
MTYCRHPYDTADDMHAALARDALRNPDPWTEVHDTRAILADLRGEIDMMRQSLVELDQELLNGNPSLSQWQYHDRLAEDLAAAEARLAQAEAD